MELTPKSDIRFLKGVGEKRAMLFSKLSVYTVSDLLCLYPRAYEDLTVITPVKSAPYDEKCCIRAKVTFGPDVKISSGGTKVYTFSAKSAQWKPSASSVTALRSASAVQFAIEEKGMKIVPVKSAGSQ